MTEYELPQAPIQKWADLRQAVEWVAFGLEPIPLAYDKALRGKIRSVQVSYPTEVVVAKKILFIALLEAKIIATGQKQKEDNTKDISKVAFEEISSDLWDIDKIKWNLNKLMISDDYAYVNIKLSTQGLLDNFPYPSLKKKQILDSDKKISAHDNRPDYISSYMKLMELAIIDLKISKNNQPSMKKLTDWFFNKLQQMDGEIYPSENKANMLATLVREPEAQKGGIIKYNKDGNY